MDDATDMALCVHNSAVLHAFKVQGLALDATGTLLSTGTDSPVTDIIDYIDQRALELIDVLPSKYRSHIAAQWNAHKLPIIQQLEEVRALPTPLADVSWHDYVGTQDVMRMLSVSMSSLNRYRAGVIPAHKPPFPTPVRYKGRSPFWLKHTIVTWRGASLQLP